MQFCLITDLNQMPHKQLTVTLSTEYNDKRLPALKIILNNGTYASMRSMLPSRKTFGKHLYFAPKH